MSQLDREPRQRTFMASDTRVRGDAVQKPTKLSVLMLDQRELLRCSIAAWLVTSCENFDVVSLPEVDDSFLNQPHSAAIQLVIFGVQLFKNGPLWLKRHTDLLRRLRSDLPMVAIIDASDSPAILSQISQAGINSYVPTTSSARVATAALQLIAAGEVYQPKLSGGCQDINDTPVQHPDAYDLSRPAIKLTPRERSVLDLLRSGIPNKVIAYRLGVSQSTVKAHVHSIIAKLQVRNRTEAALKGGQLISQIEVSKDSIPPLVGSKPFRARAGRLDPATSLEDLGLVLDLATLNSTAVALRSDSVRTTQEAIGGVSSMADQAASTKRPLLPTQLRSWGVR